MAETQKERGTVLGFNNKVGWGWVRPDDGGEDLFVHASEVTSPISRKPGAALLAAGQTVRYTPEQREKGPRAVDVEVIRDGTA